MDGRQRFIKAYGYILVGCFVGTLWVVYVSSSTENSPFYEEHFGIGVGLWYFVTAIGLLARQKWAYYLFKFFLYVLFVAFPIGTAISYFSLRYMKRNHVKDLFTQTEK